MTSLMDYVWNTDQMMSWEIISKKKYDDLTFYHINLISHIWEHTVHVFVPSNIISDIVLLRVGSGTIGSDCIPDKMMHNIAIATNTVTAKLFSVPNQPIIFNDNESLIEDAAMAHSWYLYCEYDNPELLINFPMVKSVVNAITMLSEFCDIKRCVLMGASKRAQTIWLTALIDKRVCAIIPLVFDTLNFQQTLPRHKQWYDDINHPLDEYHRYDIFTLDNLEKLSIIDPYTYRDRIHIPKYIINSTGDKFFLPDSSNYYFHDISGTNLLLYISNTCHDLHSLKTETICNFYQHIIHDIPFVTYEWKILRACIHISLQSLPKKQTIWYAINPINRDFRLSTIGPNWKSIDLIENENWKITYYPDCYELESLYRGPGYIAFYIEFEYMNITTSTGICIK